MNRTEVFPICIRVPVPLTDSMSYGGLRLKSLVYHDGVSASGDTVLYRYPLPGIPMYPEITNVEVLQYSGFPIVGAFEDEIQKDLLF